MREINCHICGRFVGKDDGFFDIIYDDYAGGYEIGYPICGQCLKIKKENRMKQRSFIDNFFDFISDPEGIPIEEIKQELVGYDIDLDELDKKVNKIITKYKK